MTSNTPHANEASSYQHGGMLAELMKLNVFVNGFSIAAASGVLYSSRGDILSSSKECIGVSYRCIGVTVYRCIDVSASLKFMKFKRSLFDCRVLIAIGNAGFVQISRNSFS